MKTLMPPPTKEQINLAENERSKRGNGRNVPLVQQDIELCRFKSDTEKYKWEYVKANKRVQESKLANVDACKIPVSSEWNIEYLSNRL